MSGHAIGYCFEGLVDIALQSSTTEVSAANDGNASASVLGATHAIDSKSDEAAYWRARWREAIAKEEDLSNRLAIAEESLEKSEAERRALIAERVSSSGERRAEARQAGADKGVLCAAMSELTLLRAHAANSKERLEAAEAERDQAVRKAKALAQELADAPGYADGAAVAAMREQLTRAMSRKAAYKAIAKEQARRASALEAQLRRVSRDLEREIALPFHARIESRLRRNDELERLGHEGATVARVLHSKAASENELFEIR